MNNPRNHTSCHSGVSFRTDENFIRYQKCLACGLEEQIDSIPSMVKAHPFNRRAHVEIEGALFLRNTDHG